MDDKTRQKAYLYGLLKYGSDGEAVAFLDGYIDGYHSFKKAHMHTHETCYQDGFHIGSTGKKINKKMLDSIEKDSSTPRNQKLAVTKV